MNKVGILCLLSLMFVQSACAASFDCDKASTKVEKLVCDTPAISKLDDGLGKLYQDVLGKAKGEQKKRLVTEQRHWLKHTRNICKDETCLKLAYWSRQAGLETFYEPKTPLYEHESDKAEAIKQVLAMAPLYLSEYTQDVPFCTQLFDDLKEMKGIHFVDPVAQTQSYEDPALDKWKQQCGPDSPPFHFSHGCEPRVSDTIHSYRDTLETPACSKEFGVSPFKVFVFPPNVPEEQQRTIIYSGDIFSSNVWEYNEIYSDKLWEMKKPKLNAKYYNSRFQQIDPSQCEPVIGVSAHIQGDRNSKNYSSIIKYHDQYYFMVFNKLYSSWRATLETVVNNGSRDKKLCRWTSIIPKTNSSSQGDK